MAENIYFVKLDEKKWGIAVRNYPGVTRKPGDTVHVRKANGTSVTKTLGPVVERFLGGRGVFFEIAKAQYLPEYADCRGGKCRSILEQCSYHSALYQRRNGRAANE